MYARQSFGKSANTANTATSRPSRTDHASRTHDHFSANRLRMRVWQRETDAELRRVERGEGWRYLDGEPIGDD